MEDKSNWRLLLWFGFIFICVPNKGNIGIDNQNYLFTLLIWMKVLEAEVIGVK